MGPLPTTLDYPGQELAANPKQLELLSVSDSRWPTFRRYLLNGRIDQNETKAQGVSVYDLIFRNILL